MVRCTPRLQTSGFPIPIYSLLGLLALTLAPSSAGAQSGQRFDDDALKPLAASLARYLEARASTVELEAAVEGLSGSLAELDKLAPGVGPLRHPSDLGRALWMSRRYEDVKVRGGSVVAETFAGGSFAGAGLELAYRLPKGYDPRSRAYPLILSIPDVDERPGNHLREHWVHGDLLDEAILLAPAMPTVRAEWTRVMVNGRPGGLSHVLTGLRFAAERLAVDPDRVYVVGRGKSVPAAIAAGNYGPQLFAGIVGRAGDAADQGPENFGSLPTLFTGAGANASAFQEAARAAGLDNCRLLPGGTEKDVWGWIQTHPRETYPSVVTVVPGDPFPTRAYWLRIAPSEPDARVTATIDRDSNTLEIEGHGAYQAILYLNDVLIDLDRPVKVVAGGAQHTLVVRRHLPTTLDLLQDGTSDAGCVYVAEVAIDLTSESPTFLSGAATVENAEFQERLAAAGSEAPKLWELYQWCASNGRVSRSEAVLRRVVRVDPAHEAARAALGHVRFEGRWFSTQAALARFQRSQDEELARAKGHVQYKSQWVHPDERALAGKGWVKDPETGQWLGPAERKRLEQGWARQDLAWIPPRDASRMDDGLWWVDGEWLDLAGANRRHSRVDNMWCIPGAEVLLYATVDRAVAVRAMHAMGRALEDLRRVFGAEPVLPLPVAVLRDEEQYDRFAFGDPDGKRPATHAGRLHVLHSAYLAESWFPRIEGKPVFRGMGVCYWDAYVPNGDLYGVHSARLAVGLSYVDALDPSPKAVRKALSDGPGPGYYATYQAEKQLPPWLRYGAAVYAERYFHDSTVGPDGDPWWPRQWSLDNLASRGGLRSLADVFAFPLDPEDREDGLKLLIEAGLVVAFVVDGECAPVTSAHEELKRSLVSRRMRTKDVEALTEALLAHEPELRAFAGL